LAIYRTLGPITYVQDNVIRTIDRAGVKVDLSPAQAQGLEGLVAIDHTGDLDLPRATVLYYDAFAFFPDMGYEQYLYLDFETGQIYRWLDGDYIALVIGGGGSVDSVNGKFGPNVVLDADDITDGSTNHKFATAAQLTKIDGVASGAQVNNISNGDATDLTDGGDSTLHYHAADRARANHTGTQSADTVVDGTTNKVFTAANQTKLNGIATGATANDTDANLKARANHTGTQSADTITDGTTNKAYTATEKTKLAGIASGATAYTNSDADARIAAAAATGTGSIVRASAPTITNATLTNYTETVSVGGSLGATKTFDLSTGTVQTGTLTANCTITMPTPTAGKSFLAPINTGAGGFTVTFTGVKWPGGSAPAATTTAGRLDLWSFVADGTNWYGNVVQNFTP
jgi:hypothetical protein